MSNHVWVVGVPEGLIGRLALGDLQPCPGIVTSHGGRPALLAQQVGDAVELVVLACDLKGALNHRLGLCKLPRVQQVPDQQAAALQLGEPVPGRARLSDHAQRRVAVPVGRTGDPVRVTKLAVSEHACVGIADGSEQVAGLGDQAHACRELAKPPDHQRAEVERNRRALLDVRRVAQHLLHALHGQHAGLRPTVGPVVDHPFGLYWHLVEDSEPARITLRQNLQQRVEQRECFAVVFELLCLIQRPAEHVDCLAVASIGRADEVRRGHTQRPDGHEHPRDPPVQHAPPRGPDALIDRLLDERVGNLEPQVPAVLVLGEQAAADQPVQGVCQLGFGLSGERGQIADPDPVPENGDQLKRRAVAVVEPRQPGADALAQVLGQFAQHGISQVGVFLEQGAQQPEREQRNATGTVHQPVDEGAWYAAPCLALRELHDRVRGERAERTAGKNPLLLERVDNTRRDGVVEHLSGPRREH